MFSSCDVLVITKIDTAKYFDFDVEKCKEYLAKINPNAKVFVVSSKTGEGVGAWVENEALWRFPIAVQNEFGEWQYAVFMLEALIAAVLLIVLLTRRYAPGERFMTALLLYACCQSLEIIKCIIGTVMVKKGIWINNIVADKKGEG